MLSHNSKYSMDIISHHLQFKNKSLKKYRVDDIETVGAWGDEPFEIKFRNNTYNKVQVKISIDGTDVLTGKPASTEIDKNMWVVNGHSTISLKAWPETNLGGAEFVFTNADNSVAFHTHGDLSNRGIIAAAVYEEDHVEPIRVHFDFNKPDHYRSRLKKSETNFKGIISTQDSVSYHDCSDFAPSAQYSYCSSKTEEKTKGLVAVGSGQHVDQKISYVTGLIKPKFAETIKIRYLWWDQLVNKLKEQQPSNSHPSGFPGDKEHKIMSIGNSPRIGKKAPESEVLFLRVS